MVAPLLQTGKTGVGGAVVFFDDETAPQVPRPTIGRKATFAVELLAHPARTI